MKSSSFSTQIGIINLFHEFSTNYILFSKKRIFEADALIVHANYCFIAQSLLNMQLVPAPLYDVFRVYDCVLIGKPK